MQSLLPSVDHGGTGALAHRTAAFSHAVRSSLAVAAPGQSRASGDSAPPTTDQPPSTPSRATTWSSSRTPGAAAPSQRKPGRREDRVVSTMAAVADWTAGLRHHDAGGQVGGATSISAAGRRPSAVAPADRTRAPSQSPVLLPSTAPDNATLVALLEAVLSASRDTAPGGDGSADEAPAHRPAGADSLTSDRMAVTPPLPAHSVLVQPVAPGGAAAPAAMLATVSLAAAPLPAAFPPTEAPPQLVQPAPTLVAGGDGGPAVAARDEPPAPTRDAQPVTPAVVTAPAGQQARPPSEPDGDILARIQAALSATVGGPRRGSGSSAPARSTPVPAPVPVAEYVAGGAAAVDSGTAAHRQSPATVTAQAPATTAAMLQPVATKPPSPPSSPVVAPLLAAPLAAAASKPEAATAAAMRPPASDAPSAAPWSAPSSEALPPPGDAALPTPVVTAVEHGECAGGVTEAPRGPTGTTADAPSTMAAASEMATVRQLPLPPPVAATQSDPVASADAALGASQPARASEGPAAMTVDPTPAGVASSDAAAAGPARSSPPVRVSAGFEVVTAAARPSLPPSSGPPAPAVAAAPGSPAAAKPSPAASRGTGDHATASGAGQRGSPIAAALPASQPAQPQPLSLSSRIFTAIGRVMGTPETGGGGGGVGSGSVAAKPVPPASTATTGGGARTRGTSDGGDDADAVRGPGYDDL
jgi:hypothetical protein